VETLANATPEVLMPLIGKTRNSRNKLKWPVKIAQMTQSDTNIPKSMENLVMLPGIGRKSANVFMREMGVQAAGVMVDLHVERVANRLGISESSDRVKIETDIMKVIPEKDWGETGMTMSFLGREICRPTNPKHSECVMRSMCQYYEEVGKKMIPGKPVKAKPAKKAAPTKKAAAKKAAPKKKARK
jgi:endonuclease III